MILRYSHPVSDDVMHIFIETVRDYITFAVAITNEGYSVSCSFEETKIPATFTIYSAARTFKVEFDHPTYTDFLEIISTAGRIRHLVIQDIITDE